MLSASGELDASTREMGCPVGETSQPQCLGKPDTSPQLMIKAKVMASTCSSCHREFEAIFVVLLRIRLISDQMVTSSLHPRAHCPLPRSAKLASCDRVPLRGRKRAGEISEPHSKEIKTR